MKKWLVVLAALMLVGCVAQSADEPPAHYSRMGRFLGLVARCGCSDISAGRMIAEYPRAVQGRYSEAEIRDMRGYVELGAHENWDNQYSICAGACSNPCLVNAVAEPMGAKTIPGVAACKVTDRNLMLEEPRTSTDG